MIRDVKLERYLPLFMLDFKEIAQTLAAEDPEFVLIWDAANQVLNNEFILTADEYGISQFEELLGITPYEEDTLESRRARVMLRWFNSLPYTWRMLVEKLTQICGESGFVISNDFETGYTITLVVNLELFGQIDDLDNLLKTMVPANIVWDFVNQIPCNIEGDATFKAGVVYADMFRITNDFREQNVINDDSTFKGAAKDTAMIIVTNDFNEFLNLTNDAGAAGIPKITESIGIND